MFFTINEKGTVEVYDILAGVRTPLTEICLCHDSLTAISSHDEGEFLAVGSSNGNVYLLECTQDFESFTKEDRVAFSNVRNKKQNATSSCNFLSPCNLTLIVEWSN